MGFNESVIDLYNTIQEEYTENLEKNKLIKDFKCKYSIEDRIGEFYLKKSDQGKKERGRVYTPQYIASYIVKKYLNNLCFSENRNIKICDPSCGTGNFIFEVIEQLINLFLTDESTESNCRKDIIKYILENNIVGYDIDAVALAILQIDVYEKYGYFITKIYNKDYLLNDKEKYDILIGNPPYIGHKSISKEYRKLLKEKYENLLIDKGDISYCFLYEAIQNTHEKGKIIFITSRYFMESLSGEKLRDELLKVDGHVQIIDFYGLRPFKGVGIDPVIISIDKEASEGSHISVIKPKIIDGEVDKDFIKKLIIRNEIYREFTVDKERLRKSKWMLINESQQKIIDKINLKSTKSIEEIADFYQGVITGCDKAFIIHNENKLKIEEYLLRRWIKNSHIQKGRIFNSDKALIYSNIINNEDIIESNVIKHLRQFEDKLRKRRECINGVRKWYELQWGRKREIFEGEKIIFPYKSGSNRFAVDHGSFFSADIYCIKFKCKELNYERLCNLFNSKLYEFYMKCMCKKLGRDLYEYYPNSLKKIRVLNIFFENENISDQKLYDYLSLNKEEIKIIENSCKIH
ncbi:Eco57I restriction-modification methylase domain-containing protein [Oceanirhabdus sp. W0125-5]|uniref:Eco57I restriction-modification methylase domain-containing protein n=1 Tax=Oceanirhabdus sp. W0125-5 TaxID=2999116 RepID=UPI0022F2B28D|nr:TaqI-like C-terminal specificity domain-containing protein [Oceanirhabdus sp. W0125-5]WBW99462.1 N-6 DNA methylase [Oceanirhabdus sp. W0125-5]